MADKPTMSSAVEGLAAAYRDAPDPKARKKLESHARTYEALAPEVRADHERLIKIRDTEPGRWAQVDLDTRAALYFYETAKAGWLAWQKEQNQ